MVRYVERWRKTTIRILTYLQMDMILRDVIESVGHKVRACSCETEIYAYASAIGTMESPW